MQLTVVEGTDLYCTFTEENVNKYFSMSFDEFSKNRKLVERFADILIGKAVKEEKIKFDEGNGYSICLYQTGPSKYSIYLRKANYDFL